MPKTKKSIKVKKSTRKQKQKQKQSINNKININIGSTAKRRQYSGPRKQNPPPTQLSIYNSLPPQPVYNPPQMYSPFTQPSAYKEHTQEFNDYYKVIKQDLTDHQTKE